MHPDYLLQSYDYPLSEDQIAQSPAPRRDGSRLLVLNRQSRKRSFTTFSHITDHIPEGALLVVNNSKVIPARIYGAKKSGGKVEFLLLTPLPLLQPEKDGDWNFAEASGLVRASKSPKQGTRVHFGPDCFLEILEKGDFGKSRVRLSWQGSLEEILGQRGKMPLPPYIKREAVEQDVTRYQTVYARDDKAGSVAAPTAGLHFTDEIRARLRNKGVQWAEVTLYVGYGTFSPVRCQDIREHAMHGEYIEVPEETAAAVLRAKEEGRPVVAVGTTSARSLEGMLQACGEIRAFAGETDIFIYPGYTFGVVDSLLTNFHLPKSSLVIMVSALAGRDFILESYAQALTEGFRVFSYGDAMLISQG